MFLVEIFISLRFALHLCLLHWCVLWFFAFVFFASESCMHCEVYRCYFFIFRLGLELVFLSSSCVQAVMPPPPPSPPPLLVRYPPCRHHCQNALLLLITATTTATTSSSSSPTALRANHAQRVGGASRCVEQRHCMYYVLRCTVVSPLWRRDDLTSRRNLKGAVTLVFIAAGQLLSVLRLSWYKRFPGVYFSHLETFSARGSKK